MPASSPPVAYLAADPGADALPAAALQTVPMPNDWRPGTRIDAMAAFQGGLYLGFGPSRGSGSAFAEASGRAASLWRFDDASHAWQAVLDQGGQPVQTRRRAIIPHVSPPGFPVGSLPGQDAGFVSMMVFQGTDDDVPCLYVATQGLGGARLLRSEDGHIFAPVLTIPASSGYLGLGALAVWEGWLVMTSRAHLPGPVTVEGPLPRCCVLGSRDPARADTWEVLSEPGFGDAENLAITALTVHQGRLCAGTANPVAGFQIWACAAGASDWTCLMNQGASRYGMNPEVALLVSHQGDLWIGTAMEQPRIAGLDWPAAELLRIEPDGVWELVAGEARLTPQGLSLPLSLLGPGFEDPGVTRLAAMAAMADGHLVVGGGPLAGLWLSADGDLWEPLLQDDGDDDIAGGVTAITAALGRVWIAMDGRLFTLGAGA